MKELKDIKPIFDWAVKNGESKIVDRILVKTIPQFLKANYMINLENIDSSSTIEVSSALYETVKNMAEELIGSSYES